MGKKGEERRVGDPVRILVADDEQNLCRILVARLTRDGYLAEAVHDGAEALDRIRRNAFDLLFLDLRMPALPGMDLLKRVREEHHPVVIVVMTAYDTPETVRAVLAGGADAYITKPFDLDAVAGSIPQLLSQQRAASRALLPETGEE